MTVWDLSRLRYTVRKLTGQFDITQLPDNSPGAGLVTVDNPPGIDDYINDVYMYDIPEILRTLKLKRFYEFTTLPNVGTYNVPQTIYQLEPPIYIDNYQFCWYQSPDQFYRIWPELNFIDQAIATTDGVSQTYTFTVTQTPVQQGTLRIGLEPNLDGNPSPQFETFTDQDTPALLDQPTQLKFTNPGTLTGNLGGTGTIDYLTGAVSITYNTAPPAGVNINAHYHPYVASRPRDIMFFQQQLFLRPIPNDVYAVKMIGYFMPTAVISSATNATERPLMDSSGNLIGAFNGSVSLSDLPEFNEWWQMLAYGAAIKIMIQEGDHEEAARHSVYYEQEKLLAQRKCLKQLANQRIPSAYSEQAGGPQWPVFPLY
jgi:hypothetical protein